MTKDALRTLNDNTNYDNFNREITGLKEHDLIENIINSLNDPNLLSYDATVGTGGDYPTLFDAFSDDKFNLKVISDITETQNFAFNPNIPILIEANGYAITFDNSTWSRGSLSNDVHLEINNAILKIKNTNDYVIGYYFIISGNYVTILNDDSSGNEVHFSLNYVYIDIRNIKIDMTNGLIFLKYIRNADTLELIGNGGNSAVQTHGNGTIKLITVTGTLGTAWNTRAIILNSTTVNWIDAPDSWILVYSNCIIKRGNYNLYAYSGKIRIYNSELTKFSVRYSVSNIKIYDTILPASIYGTFQGNLKLVQNCTITNNVNITADNLRIINCNFDGDVTVDADNVNIEGCTLENGTITIDATADKTVITSSRTLTTIIDNGIDTQLLANNLI